METLPTPRIPRISGTLAAPPRETVLRPRKPALHEKRLVLVLALASMLGGCVVVPARPAYRPAPNYYYYPAYPGRTTIIVTAIEPRPALTPEAIMTRPIGFPFLRPLAAAALFATGAAQAQTYAPPPAPPMTRRTPPTPTWRRWTAVPPAAAPARLHPAAAARRRLYLGARLLEPEPQRLLLGAGRLGAGAVYRRAVDAGLLGFRGRHLSVARRLLGPHIGFYGGINYGFGYIGIGFVGGYWNHDRYFYNRAVTNVNVTHITNVYTHNVVVNNIDNRRISYNGGPNGIRRMADPREAAARNEAHIPPTAAQRLRALGRRRSRAVLRAQPGPPAARLHGARPPGAGSRPDGAPSPGAGPRGDRHNDSGLRSTSTAPRPDQNPGGPGPRPNERAAPPQGREAQPPRPQVQAPPQVREQAPQPRMQRQERGPDNLAQPMHNERQRGRRWKRPARSRPARRR